MRVITDLKSLQEWQLTQKEDGKSRALLLLSNGAPASEQIQLIKAARTRCDAVLAVADVHERGHTETLHIIADNGCHAVLLWDKEKLYPDNSLCLEIQPSEHYPKYIRSEALRHFASQLLHLRCLFQPTLTVLEQHDFPKLWLARKLSFEYFRSENITAVNVKPESAQSAFLLTVLERCALAIKAGKDFDETLERARRILRSRHHRIEIFDCFHREDFEPSYEFRHAVLWARTHCQGEKCQVSLEM